VSSPHRSAGLRAGILAATLTLSVSVAGSASGGEGGRAAMPTRASRSPLQPVITAPPPRQRHRFDLGTVRVAPSAIVAGAPDQNIRVTVDADRSAGLRALRIRLYRPALASSPRTGRAITRIGVASRTVGLNGGAPRSFKLSDLNPAPGRYRLEILDPTSGRVLGKAPILVYAQDRLPPQVLGGQRSPIGATGATAAGAPQRSAVFSLPSPSINNNVSNEGGDQAETYTAAQPNNASRVIAGVNPASGNPQAWVSNDSMRPGTTTVSTLPSTNKLPTSEGGGTVSAQPCCDPTFAADDRGNFWYGSLTLGPGQSCGTPPTCNIIVNRVAGPTGTSLQAQNTAIPRATADLQDKPMITIDSWPTSPNRYMLYATWIENPGQNVVVSQCDATTASNCDNPDSWSVPAHVTGVGATYSYPSVAAAPNGDVYVAWWDQTNDDIRIDRCLAAEDCTSAASWNEDSTLDSDLDPASATSLPFFCPIISAPGGRVGPQPYVDVGPDGRVYVSYSQLRNNGTTRCTASGTDRTFDSLIDAGAANTIPATDAGVRISDDAATAANDHFFPTLAADPSASATVESSLYSTKLDATGRATQQFYVRSTDGGASYSAMQQISTEASDFSGGNSNGFDYGDYEGADAAGGVFYPAWTDNRLSQGGDSELFMLTPPGSPSTGGGGGDVTPPNTKITGGPKARTTSRTARFRFKSTEAGSTFKCKLDKKKFKACHSPKTFKHLRLGKHRFKVEAIDAAGNVDSSPATRSWKVIAA
jgi:hypothetical protein